MKKQETKSWPTLGPDPWFKKQTKLYLDTYPPTLVSLFPRILGVGIKNTEADLSLVLDELQRTQSSRRGGMHDTLQMEQGGRHQALTHHILGRPIYSSKKLKEHNNDLLCCQRTQCPLIRGLNGSIMIIKSHVWDFRCTAWQAIPPLSADHEFPNLGGRHLTSPHRLAIFFMSSHWSISNPFLANAKSEMNI